MDIDLSVYLSVCLSISLSFSRYLTVFIHYRSPSQKFIWSGECKATVWMGPDVWTLNKNRDIPIKVIMQPNSRVLRESNARKERRVATAARRSLNTYSQIRQAYTPSLSSKQGKWQNGCRWKIPTQGTQLWVCFEARVTTPRLHPSVSNSLFLSVPLPACLFICVCFTVCFLPLACFYNLKKKKWRAFMQCIIYCKWNNTEMKCWFVGLCMWYSCRFSVGFITFHLCIILTSALLTSI